MALITSECGEFQHRLAGTLTVAGLELDTDDVLEAKSYLDDLPKVCPIAQMRPNTPPARPAPLVGLPAGGGRGTLRRFAAAHRQVFACFSRPKDLRPVDPHVAGASAAVAGLPFFQVGHCLCLVFPLPSCL